MFQHSVTHGNPALDEAEVLALALAKLMYCDFARDRRCSMAILHAAIPLVPAGKECFPLFL